MVAMVCGMVLSFLAILLAMVCWKWYAHCLLMLTTSLISSLSLSRNVAGDISDAHASVIPPLSPLQLLVSQCILVRSTILRYSFGK